MINNDKHYVAIFAAEWCGTGRKHCDSQRSRRFGLSSTQGTRRSQKEFHDVSHRQPLSALDGILFLKSSWNLVGRHVRSFVCARLSWFLHISALEAKGGPCAVQWCWSRLLEGSQNERVVGLSLLASSTARVSLGHPQSASIKMFSLCKEAKRFWMHKVLRAVLQEFQSIAQHFLRLRGNQRIRLRLLFYWHLLTVLPSPLLLQSSALPAEAAMEQTTLNSSGQALYWFWVSPRLIEVCFNFESWSRWMTEELQLLRLQL